MLHMLSELDNFGPLLSEATLLHCSENIQQICRRIHMLKSAISIKLQSNFIETTLRRGCFAENFPHTFRTPLPKKNFGGMLVFYQIFTSSKSLLQADLIIIPISYNQFSTNNTQLQAVRVAFESKKWIYKNKSSGLDWILNHIQTCLSSKFQKKRFDFPMTKISNMTVR